MVVERYESWLAGSVGPFVFKSLGKLAVILAGLQVFGWWLKLDEEMRTWTANNPLTSLSLAALFMSYDFYVWKSATLRLESEFRDRIQEPASKSPDDPPAFEGEG